MYCGGHLGHDHEPGDPRVVEVLASTLARSGILTGDANSSGKVVKGKIVTRAKYPEGTKLLLVPDEPQPEIELDAEDRVALDEAIEASSGYVVQRDGDQRPSSIDIVNMCAVSPLSTSITAR